MSIKVGILAGVVTTVLGGLGLAVVATVSEGSDTAQEATQERAFTEVWTALSATEKQDACLAITIYGTDGVEALLASELDGSPADAAYVAERITEECAE